jgi:hypothetical protein
VFSGEQICLNGFDLSAAGTIDFLSPTILCVDSVVSGSNVWFHSTVDDTIDGQQSLTVNVNGPGVARFDGAVGSALQLESLRVNGPSEMNAGLIKTKYFQDYNGPVTMGTDNQLLSTADRQIRFRSTLDGHYLLDVFTGGETRFDGKVGGIDPLLSLYTDRPGFVSIGGDMHAGFIIFKDAAYLLRDVTLVGDSLVKFDNTLNGNRHDLTVNSPRTEFRDDAIRLNHLRTDAAGVTIIGFENKKEEGEHDGEEILIQANDIFFGDRVELESDAHIIGRDRINFDMTLDGPFKLLADSNRLVRFGGNVGEDEALEELTTRVGPPGLVNRNLVLIDGRLVRVTGDINFNPDGRNRPAEVATIAARNARGVRIISEQGDVTMGMNEKLTSLGDLSISAHKGTAVLGDLNARGDIDVRAAQIALRSRSGGQILNSAGNFVNDDQADVIATGNITFNRTPVVLGAGDMPIFASRNGQVNSKLSGFEFRSASDLGNDDFRRGETVLDLTAAAAPIGSDLATAFAGPIPVRDRIYLDPFALRDTGNLAINMRGMQPTETREVVAGRELYLDPDSQPGMTPETRQISTNRLRRTAVLGTLDQYNKIYLTQQTDENGNPIGEPKDNTDHVGQVIATAWKAYASNAGTDASAAGFRAWLNENKDQQAEALAYINGLREMYRNLGDMGLTRVELANSVKKVYPKIKPAGIDDATLRELLNVPA